MKKISQKSWAWALVLLFLTGTALAADDASTLYDYQGIAYINVSVPIVLIHRNSEPWVERIRTQEAWVALDNKAAAVLKDPNYVYPPVPVYDFEHYELVMGGIGPKVETYFLNIQGVTYIDGKAHIWLHEISYACSGFRDFGLGFPSVPMAVLVRKTDKPIAIHAYRTEGKDYCIDISAPIIQTLP